MSNQSCLPDSFEGEYSLLERKILLDLARRAIDSTLAGRDVDLSPPTPHLAEKRGAFTSLHLEGQLRGCVGYVMPEYPLYRTVGETAVAAAFHDPRFYQVTPEEAQQLKIEISVLTVPEPIAPEDVVVGKHGLIVSHRGRRGLLLPQVPQEHDWDRLMFLAQTCLKAGLPADVWKNGATVEAFTAEVFGE